MKEIKIERTDNQRLDEILIHQIENFEIRSNRALKLPIETILAYILNEGLPHLPSKDTVSAGHIGPEKIDSEAIDYQAIFEAAYFSQGENIGRNIYSNRIRSGNIETDAYDLILFSNLYPRGKAPSKRVFDEIFRRGFARLDKEGIFGAVVFEDRLKALEEISEEHMGQDVGVGEITKYTLDLPCRSCGKVSFYFNYIMNKTN